MGERSKWRAVWQILTTSDCNLLYPNGLRRLLAGPIHLSLVLFSNEAEAFAANSGSPGRPGAQRHYLVLRGGDDKTSNRWLVPPVKKTEQTRP